MVGRTPEYLGKKVEAFEMKMAMLVVLVLGGSILGFTALASATPEGLAGPLNPGPHGFSEILYAFSSQTGNNGSAFAGLTGNTPFYNMTGALAMLIGRYGMIIPILAMAGSMAAKRRSRRRSGRSPRPAALFSILLIGVIVIVGALTFFPALALGPIVEQLLQNAGMLFCHDRLQSVDLPAARAASSASSGSAAPSRAAGRHAPEASSTGSSCGPPCRSPSASWILAGCSRTR